MPILHMQTDAARAVEQQITQNAQLLESEFNNLNQSIQTLLGSWQGSSADQFSQEVRAILARLRNCQITEQDLAGALGREISEWEQVASALGGGGGAVAGSRPAGPAILDNGNGSGGSSSGADNGSSNGGASGGGSSAGGVASNNQKGGGSVSAAPQEPSVPTEATEPHAESATESEPSTANQAPPAAAPSGPGVGSGLNPWTPVDPSVTNDPGNRSANAYDTVLNQFNVGQNGRYAQNQQGKGETYCNIFVWDVTKAMGVEIPHWVDGNGNGVGVGQGGELSANGQIAWLETHGASRGWRAVGAAEAQALANNGQPTIATWDNPGGIAHVGMVRPGENMALAQAGGRNFNDGTVTDGFGDRPIVYYVND